jgi:hypothetical protein
MKVAQQLLEEMELLIQAVERDLQDSGEMFLDLAVMAVVE